MTDTGSYNLYTVLVHMQPEVHTFLDNLSIAWATCSNCHMGLINSVQMETKYNVSNFHNTDGEGDTCPSKAQRWVEGGSGVSPAYMFYNRYFWSLC